MEKNFYVITSIFNPAGFKSRTSLYYKFAEYMKLCGVKLITIELQYGELPFECTEYGNPDHIQLRTGSVLWHKEQLINLAVQRLPETWKYMAWIDADVTFLNKNWVADTLRALQFHPVVQMFSQAMDLNPHNEVIRTHTGIGYAHQSDLLSFEDTYNKMYGKNGFYECLGLRENQKKNVYHPGFAWAIRRATYNGLGGLLDFAALGSADQHMAHAFVGQLEKTVHNGFSPEYKKMLMDWQVKADKHVKRNLGYVSGGLIHHWHGSKKNRGYTTRFNTLIEHQYNPLTDLDKDWQGLYRWTDRCLDLRYDIYRYFLSRKEDNGTEE